MKLINLALTNFRNHKKFKIKFDEKITLITGKNGSGKTNILEAIHLLSTSKSFRAGYDKEMINHDSDFTRIDAETSNGDRSKLEMIITKSTNFENASSKKVKINGVTKTIYNFCEKTKTVLFTPEDIELITGSPSQRRKYIDLVLFQTGIEYKRASNVYSKALRQRNKLLEMINEQNVGQGQIDYWTDKVLENGMIIQNKRDEFFTFLKEAIKEHGAGLSGKDQVVFGINYKKNQIDEKRLDLYKEKEIMAKSTLVGPHRDDFEITMNNLDISAFGSRGQQRSAVLALKLGEVDYFTQFLYEQPVLLLDDIFSELDKNHREAVMKVMNGQQTIITSTEHFDLPFEFEEIKLI